METTVRRNGISIVSSPFLEPLTDQLAAHMAVVPADPFASEVVVVPNVGVRDWLQRELGTRLRGDGAPAGIVANVRFMFVQQFLDTVFAASDGVADPGWDIERLTWVVHRAIDSVGRSSIPSASAKPLTTARVVADLFDRYGVHRPSMLLHWRQGRAVDGVEPLAELPDHARWQQRLYAEVCRLATTESPADRIAMLEDRVRVSGLSEALPERVALFGFVTMNTTLRVVLDAIGAERSVHLYLVHPARHRDAAPADRALGHIARSQGTVSESGNPLLARWGRPILEMRQLLVGDWSTLAVPVEDPSTDLERLRRSIIEDRPISLAPLEDDPDVLAQGDGSVQVHACHGRVRQVEVLRDALLHMLADDPTLRLSDISIQCPDLVSFAPIIPAVFASGSAAGESGPPALDVSIADRVLVGENLVEDAFWSLLDVARSRCGTGEMLTMLAAPPIQRRFGIDEDALSRITDWVDAMSVRFGLDVEHRRAWDVPDTITVGTWDAALDRLFMGLAIPAETLFAGPGGIVPFDDVSVSDAPVLARLADFLTRLKRLVGRLSTAHSIDEWVDILSSIISDFFDGTESQDFAMAGLIDAIARVAEAARVAGVGEDEMFSIDEVAAIVRDVVTSAGSRPRFRTGAIPVTELLPQQGVPYRVIALLGVSESQFAAGGVRGDDILSLRPCIGDPMPAASGRLQLLDVLLAARDALIITCDGADINNNKAIPLPVPVQELLEATCAVISDKDDMPVSEDSSSRQCRILTQHPRQNFSLRSLTSGEFRSDRPFTFDPVALEVHGLLQEPAAPLLAGRRSDVPLSAEASPVTRVTTQSMRRVMGRPADYFVQDVLGMRLPMSDSHSAHDFVDFWPSHLEYSRAGRELLDSLLRSSGDPQSVVEQRVRTMRLGGVFPPGRLGDTFAEQVSAEVLSILALLPPHARRSEDYRSIDIDDVLVPGSDGEVMTGTVENVLGLELIRPSFTKFREDLVLEPWIELAIVSHVFAENPWSVRMVGRGSKGEGVGRTFTLVGSDEVGRRASAHRVLETARTMMACCARGRIPYLPKTAERLARATVSGAQSVYEGEGEYSAAIQFLFGKVTWDEFIAEEAWDDDPAGRGSSRAQRFATFVWDAFHATTIPVADPSGAP